jgi:hypothetical protein
MSLNAIEYTEVPLEIVTLIIAGEPLTQCKFQQTCKLFNHIFNVKIKSNAVSNYGRYTQFYHPEYRWMFDLQDFTIHTRIKANSNTNIISIRVKSTGECIMRALQWKLWSGVWQSHDDTVSYGVSSNGIWAPRTYSTFTFKFTIKATYNLKVVINLTTNTITECTCT